MRSRASMIAMLWTVLIAGCSGSPGGPANLGRINSADDDPPPVLQSNDIMERDQRADKAQVKHILISWRDLADAFDGHQDERAQNRSRGEAEKLVKELYNRAVAGEPFEALMAEYSEDQGSASTGISYEVFPGSSHVFEFRRMGIRLEVGEVGKVLSQFGWHVMKRVE